MRRSMLLAGTTALALTLAACGGNGGGETTTPADAGTTPVAEETTPATEETTEAAEEETTEGEEEETEAAGPVSEEGTIVLWTDDNRQAAMQAAADKFTADTGVAVELVVKNFDDIRADFAAQVPTGEGPDLTIGAHDWLGELITDGVIAPVELGAAADSFSEAAISAFANGGQVYGVPMSVENTAIIRNVDLAPEPTPATFDEMIAAGEETDAEFPFLIQLGENGDPYHMYAFQTSFGAEVFNRAEDGSYTAELGMGGAEGEAFATWLSEQGAAGTLDTAIDGDQAKQQFIDGNSPYILGGPWLIQDFEGMNLAVDPIPSAGGEPSQPFMGVQGVYLSAESLNTIDAIDFMVNYIASPETQLEIFEAGNRIPANSEAAAGITDNPLIQGFAAVSEGAAPMPSIPEMASVWEFWGVTEAQIVGGGDAAALWSKMVSDIEGAIAAS